MILLFFHGVLINCYTFDKLLNVFFFVLFVPGFSDSISVWIPRISSLCDLRLVFTDPRECIVVFFPTLVFSALDRSTVNVSRLVFFASSVSPDSGVCSLHGCCE